VFSFAPAVLQEFMRVVFKALVPNSIPSVTVAALGDQNCFSPRASQQTSARARAMCPTTPTFQDVMARYGYDPRGGGGWVVLVSVSHSHTLSISASDGNVTHRTGSMPTPSAGLNLSPDVQCVWCQHKVDGLVCCRVEGSFLCPTFETAPGLQ